MRVEVKTNEYGHIKRESLDAALVAAEKVGVLMGLRFSTLDGRRMEVRAIGVRWDGVVQAKVRNVETGRNSTTAAEAVARLLARAGARR